jgi:hypothetical protein
MILHDKTFLTFGYTFDGIGVYNPICCHCDYCGVEFSREKRSILCGRKYILKDACKQCTSLKRNEVQILLYGEDYKNVIGRKARSAFVSKHGVDSLEIKDKIKKTCLLKYGKTSYLGTKEARDKTKESSLKKYGTEHPTQSAIVKEKAKNTNQEKYGVDYFSQTKEWQDKTKAASQQNFGTDNPAQSDVVKDKMKQTNQEKYGVDYALQNPDSIQKLKDTCVERYGKENYSQTLEYREKYRTTCLERYGVEYPLQNERIFLKSIATKIAKYGRAFGLQGKTKTQDEIQQWLNSYGYNFQSNHSLLKGKEIDLYDDMLKIGIEFCGLYWHNECSPEPRLRSYHYNKYKQCKDQNVRLLTIFEDEWALRNNQCKDFILSLMNICTSKIMARKCSVDMVSNKECALFCEDNHIQGKTHSKVCFGLFYNNEMIGVVSLAQHHRQSDKHQIVLNRICFKSGVQVIGGAGKLLAACKSWCKNNNYATIITWSDNRWSEGNMYSKLNFSLDTDLPPDYSYVDTKQRIRVSKQSCKKSNTQCPPDMTEKKWLLNNGLARIWDCGKKRWICNVDVTQELT